MKSKSFFTSGLVLTSLIVLLALAACAPPPAPIAEPDQQPAAATDETGPSLEGTLWVMQSYVDADGQTLTPIPNTRTTAELIDGTIGGNAGCNQYSGSYVLDGANLEITLGPMTMMACPEPIMQQEMQYVAALGDVRSYEISGNQLSMMDESGAIVLTFAADQPLPLVGTNWQVQSYNNGRGGLVSSLNSELMTAVYAADGTVSGFSGCNNYNGPYTTDGNAITIGPLVTTRKACLEPETLMGEEADYLLALDRVRTYEIKGEELTMFDEGGTRTVVYRAAVQIDDVVAGATLPGSEEPIIDSVMIEQRDDEWIAIVQGQNADACPRMYLPSQEVSANDIAITLSTVRPQDAICAQALTPFSEEVAIDTSGLEPGEYSVSVNGVAADQPIAVGMAAATVDGNDCAGIDLNSISLDTQGLPYSWQPNCIPAQPYDESMPPGPMGMPEHVVINFGVTDPADRQPGDPIMYLIPVNAYEAMWNENGNDAVSITMDQIQFQTALLPTPPETAGYPALPFEETGAGYNDLTVQVGRAAPTADSASKNGFRFVGRWAQDANPVTNRGLRYVYQGLTNDGRYLVSFWYPVSTSALPNDIEDVTQEAMDAFTSDPAATITAEAERLNALPTSDWEPDLTNLDALVGSLAIAGMPANILTNGVWQWTGMRNPNTGEETPLQDEGMYRLTFNADGTYSLQADCNNTSGSYEAEGGMIGRMRFGVGPTTLVECGPESQSSNLIGWLPGIQDYRGHAGGDTLDLSLPAGGGELIFMLEGMDASGDMHSAAKTSVSGMITYRQRIALPADAVVQVQIQDVSLADAPAKIMGEQIIDNPGQAPIAYDVPYNPADIIDNHSYSMSARITDASGKLLFISDTMTPVITRDNPTTDVEIVVVPVG